MSSLRKYIQQHTMILSILKELLERVGANENIKKYVQARKYWSEFNIAYIKMFNTCVTKFVL